MGTICAPSYANIFWIILKENSLFDWKKRTAYSEIRQIKDTLKAYFN